MNILKLIGLQSNKCYEQNKLDYSLFALLLFRVKLSKKCAVLPALIVFVFPCHSTIVILDIRLMTMLNIETFAYHL